MNLLFSVITTFVFFTNALPELSELSSDSLFDVYGPNGCVNFQIGPGTGCAWMCNYCASQLGTNNYYFTSGVCTYENGGCVGNPSAGATYTCCSA